MISSLVPPADYPPCVVMGNYESENNKDDLTCPLCGLPSGWDYILWIDNIPEQGLYCSNCHETFYEGDLYNG